MQSNLMAKKGIEDVLKFTGALTQELERLELFNKIASIRQDILGAYFFYIPEIQVYWMVIGLFAGMLGVSAECEIGERSWKK